MKVEGSEYQLKPMNCPYHIMIYKSHLRSYRDLPIRYGELGTVYRYERTGVLHGLLRVRGFTQDDAHLFCRPWKVALRDVDLVIPEGDFVFLVGPSGAGKSTLIKLLIRDELATQRRRSSLDGQDLARLPRRQVPQLRRKIGIVFQDFKLLPTEDGLRERRLRAGGHRHAAAADQARRRPRARARRPHRPGASSCPTSSRAASSSARRSPGRSSTTRASLIADEPTGNLDPLISWEIIQLLLRINELGVTVLMATHNAEIVTALRKRVVALEEGRVIRDEVGGAYHRED